MSETLVQPYLFFGGRCEEALEFYQRALGAQAGEIYRYRDSPDPVPPGAIPEGFEDKVMHTSLTVGSTTLLLSDGCEQGQGHAGYSLSLTVPSEGDADRVFAALAAGGKVDMPLCKTFWSPRFGMLTDRFGIGWMISVAPEA
ncbi:MAG: VOC family protein [Armatimonadetes bacterium]|nr:VOC family protein [Armatimonadota bacterium]